MSGLLFYMIMDNMSQSNKNTVTKKRVSPMVEPIVNSSIEPMGLSEILRQEHQLSLFDDLHMPKVVATEAAARVKYKSKEKSLEQVSRPLRICIAGYRSAPFGGWQGIYIKYLSKALVEAGHQVDVISGQPYPEVDPRVNLIKLPGLDLFNHGLRSLRPHHLTS
ncbi:MAG: hypothetical protein ACPG3T_04575, partial [Pseudomonadales bacterium]